MTITKRINITLIFFSLLIISIIVFAIVPLFQAIGNNSKEVVVQKQKMSLLEVESISLKENEPSMEPSHQFMEEVGKLFIDSEVPLEFINFLEDVSQECQLNTEILPSFEKNTEKDVWSYSTFQLVSSGYFFNFLKLLEKLENSPYLIDVQNMNISRVGAQEEGGLTNIKASFAIKVFVK